MPRLGSPTAGYWGPFWNCQLEKQRLTKRGSGACLVGPVADSVLPRQGARVRN